MIVVPRITATILVVGIVIKQLITNRRKFRSQTSAMWTDEKQRREEAERRERLEERRVEEKE